jgi:hypothetical protein
MNYIRMMALWLVASCVALGGCSSGMNNMMQSWVGAPESELIGAWGPPNDTFHAQDGSTWYTWRKQLQTISGSRSVQVRNGVVSSWSWEGANGVTMYWTGLGRRR